MYDSNDPVPLEQRRSVLGISLVLAGVPFCVSGLLVGGALSKGLSLSQGIEAALLGGVVLTLYAGFIGAIGARTGLSTTAILRECFGSAGSAVVAVVLALTLIGWYAVQCGFFGQTMHTLFPEGGVLTSPGAAALWGGLLMLSSAFFGIRGLALVSWLGVPLFALLSAWGLHRALVNVDVWGMQPSSPVSLGSAVTMVIGSFAVGATVNADITRFARNVRHAWIATASGFLVANVFVLFCGAATSVATGTGDLIKAMVVLGMGVPALLVLILGQWTTNDNNLYYATSNLEAAFPRLKHKPLVLCCGSTATLLGTVGFADHFVPFLVWLGVTIPPIGGVLIAHYITRKAGGSLPVFRLVPFAAWIGGSVTGALVKTGVPAINSIVTAFLLYILLRRLENLQSTAQR